MHKPSPGDTAYATARNTGTQLTNKGNKMSRQILIRGRQLRLSLHSEHAALTGAELLDEGSFVLKAVRLRKLCISFPQCKTTRERSLVLDGFVVSPGAVHSYTTVPNTVYYSVQVDELP